MGTKAAMGFPARATRLVTSSCESVVLPGATMGVSRYALRACLSTWVGQLCARGRPSPRRLSPFADDMELTRSRNATDSDHSGFVSEAIFAMQSICGTHHSELTEALLGGGTQEASPGLFHESVYLIFHSLREAGAEYGTDPLVRIN